MDSWHSYPTIFALGHRALADLFADPVLVQEKIDGSQFSMGVFGEEVRCRSKGAPLNMLAPDRMFERAVALAQTLPLHEGWTYRGEYLQKPKHNALAYDRVPQQHVILFDINTGHEAYLPYEAVCVEGARLGLEVVPRLHAGVIEDIGMFRGLLETVSCLGGQKVEGVVVKNYARFGPDKKCLMGKFVSEAFKEVHAREWKSANPTSGDIVEWLTERYHSAARWQKAVQHLREAGALLDEPKDIALLMREIPSDIEKECAEEIKALLYEWAWPKIRRGVMHGMPEWYKERLLERQFEAAP